MGYLKNKTVYLAGPIAAAQDDGFAWREKVTGILKDYNLKVIDPTIQKIEGISETGKHKKEFKKLLKNGEFAKVKELFWPILRRDLRSVDESNFLIWYYDPEIPTVGTIHEVVICSHIERKPVLMFVPEDKLGSISAWALTFVKPSWVFTDWNMLNAYLAKIDNKQFDSSKWIF